VRIQSNCWPQRNDWREYRAKVLSQLARWGYRRIR
jgi:hypothetical protein